MGKIGVLEHKSGNISAETRKDRGKLTIELEGLQELTNALSNGTIPIPRPPTASLSKDWGFANPTQNSSRYYLRNGYKAGYSLQIWQQHSQGPSEQKTIKNFGKSSRWRTQGLSKMFGVSM